MTSHDEKLLSSLNALLVDANLIKVRVEEMIWTLRNLGASGATKAPSPRPNLGTAPVPNGPVE